MARTITGTNTVGITLTLQSDNPVTVASGGGRQHDGYP